MLTEKFILDATAGFRMMWFDKKHPNCIYLDQRPECEPDVVGDFRDLKQFDDETFRLIVFDPPHFLTKNPEENFDQVRKYGALHPETWQHDLQIGFQELWRVLSPYGVLLLKWSNVSINSSKLLSLLPIKPLIYQVTAKVPFIRKDGTTRNRSDEAARTLWFCFMKIPKETEQP